MLVLSRKVGQSFTIGRNIKVTILSHKDGTFRIGIEAPKHIKVLRDELLPYLTQPEDTKPCNPD